MSIDTAAKRYSARDLGIPFRGPSVFPDSTIAQSDRSALIGFYSGISFGNTYTLQATAGSFAWTGSDAILEPTTHINTSLERFASMNIGNVWRGINCFPTGSVGRATRTALANFYTSFGPEFTYSMQCTSGTFVWDGEPSFSDFEIGATAGVFTMTGNSATLIATRTLFATAGVFAMTGSDSNMQKLTTRTLFGGAGTFSMTGNSATFDRPRTLEAVSGIFASEGYEVTLTYTDQFGGTYTGSGSKRKDAGSNKKKRRKVEIDGEVYEVNSTDEAEQILELLKARAEKTAKEAIERAVKAQKRPTRKILQDARKTLVYPEINGPQKAVESIESEIEKIYSDALRTIEIAARLRNVEEEDDIIFMLL